MYIQRHADRKILALVGISIISPGTAVAMEQQWLKTFNAAGQVTSIDGPMETQGDTTFFEFDEGGNHLAINEPLGHSTTFGDHNHRGQPGRVTDINGVESVMTYHPRGWLLSRTRLNPGNDSAAHATTRYRYDNNGQLLAIEFPDASELSYEYDDAQRLIAISNGIGDRLEYTLDAAGNRIHVKTRSADGTMTRQIDYGYDELNRLIRTSASGAVLKAHHYDRNGNRTERINGTGVSITSYYDALDRVREIRAPLNTVASYQYDARGNLSALTDPLQSSTYYHHDGFDKLTSVASNDNGAHQYTYDNAGNRWHSLAADGRTTINQYDTLGRLVAENVGDPEFNISYGYDQGLFGKGKLTSIGTLSGVSTYNYSAAGNLAGQETAINGLSMGLQYDYTANGKLSHITYPSGREVAYNRDKEGRVTSVTTADENNPTEILANNINYLPFGEITSLSYGNGLHYSASFDTQYRPTAIAVGSLFEWLYDYDDSGSTTRVEGLNGRSEFSYDELDRLITATNSQGQWSYTYDANGNRLSVGTSLESDSYQYDPAGNRLLATHQWSYNYDASGNRIAKVTRLDDSGDGTFYQYDARNRLTRVTERITAGEGSQEQIESVLASYTYNAKGQLASRTGGEESLHYVYGPDGLLMAEIRGDGQTLREYIYLDNQPLAIMHTALIEIEAQTGPAQILDNDTAGALALGEWSRIRKKGSIGDYYRRSNNAGNRYRWTPDGIKNASYELYAWWPKNKKLNKAAQFTVSHHGTKTEITRDQSQNGKQWVFLGTFAFNGDGGEYVELSDLGGTTAADAIRIVEIIPATVEARITQSYVHNDHLGTPHRLTDRAGNTVWAASYRPFGGADISVAEVTNNLRFPGQYFDEATGLHHNHFRDYDPETGRYLQPDPIGLAAGLNPYAYVVNNPLKRADPNGLCPWCVVGAGVGAGYEGLRQFHSGTLALNGNSLGKIAVASVAGALTGGFGSIVNQAGLKGLTALAANGQFGLSNGLTAEIIAAAIDQRTLSQQDLYAIILGALGGAAVGTDAGLDELTSLVFAELAEDGINSLVRDFEQCPDN